MNRTFGRILLTVLMLAFLVMGVNTARVMAYSPCDLYDMVWKLVNNKFVDQTNNNQDWTRWRHKYDSKIQTNEVRLKGKATGFSRKSQNFPESLCFRNYYIQFIGPCQSVQRQKTFFVQGVDKWGKMV